MSRLLLIGWAFFCHASVAQEPPVTTQQQLEDVTEMLETENLEDDNYLQLLDQYLRHPVNINLATEAELQPLRLLNAVQMASLLQYRSKLGPFISIYELQAVPGFDVATIRRIQPYIYVAAAGSVYESFRQRLSGGEARLLLRYSRVLEQARGYDRGLRDRYAGDPNQLQMRYRYQYKNLLYYGLLGDKDAGEHFFSGAQKQGFDFYSAHFLARRIGVVQEIALGDYLANLGQGLIQWQSLAFGKSADITQIKRQSPVLMPYRSAGEYYFNRGAGITLGKGAWSFTVFGSAKKITANYVNDTMEKFTSIHTSGYHRTPAEIADRYKVHHDSWGGSLKYSGAAGRIAFNTVRHGFSIPFIKNDQPYNHFAIRSRSMQNHSVDYAWTKNNFHFFGEAAIDGRGHPAMVTGFLASLNQSLDLSFLYRNLSKGYQAMFGNAFTEASAPGNENGVFGGIRLRPVGSLVLNAYADLFEFPFFRFLQHGPARGFEYLLNLSYAPSKHSEVYLRWRKKNRPVNQNVDAGPIVFPDDAIRQSIRFNLVMPVADNVQLKARAEWMQHVMASGTPDLGFLSYVDVGWKFRGVMSANMRLQYFETDGYSARIYAYENDVLYSFSIPAFYGQGLRGYVNVSLQKNDNFRMWFRLSRFHYLESTSIGSGLTKIPGKNKTEIKIQIEYSL